MSLYPCAISFDEQLIAPMPNFHGTVTAAVFMHSFCCQLCGLTALFLLFPVQLMYADIDVSQQRPPPRSQKQSLVDEEAVTYATVSPTTIIVVT
jgi:hypothetical protein